MNLLDMPTDEMAGCRHVPVRVSRSGVCHDSTAWVAEEVPVALEYNGVSHAVMLATPADLEDFALGFSLTEGIVQAASQVYDTESRVSAQGITVALTVATACFAGLKQRRRSMAGRTGCGLCGTESLDHAVRQPAAVPPAQAIDAACVARALVEMRARQALLNRTGATHAAAWCDATGQVVAVREDVGRHNALDKLVGAMARQAPGAQGFITVTSRASYEMVQKAAAAGAHVLAAVSGVTALAIDVAQASGVALAGFARGDDLSVYSHPHHIVFAEPPWTPTT